MQRDMRREVEVGFVAASAKVISATSSLQSVLVPTLFSPIYTIELYKWSDK
jgi:hypothetical protein